VGASIDQDPPARLDRQHDVVGDRQVGDQRQLLVHDADAGGQRVGRRREPARVSSELDRSLVRHERAAEDGRERGLAGAVLADDRVHFPRV
jgi:hypothetical protein